MIGLPLKEGLFFVAIFMAQPFWKKRLTEARRAKRHPL